MGRKWDEERAVISITNRLLRTATALGRITAKVHKGEEGLTAPEFTVLMALGRSGRESLTSSHIVEMTAMDKTKVSRAVSSLDQRGWLTRTRAVSDRRFEHLALTGSGIAAFERLLPKIYQAEDSVLNSLSAEERNGLERGLEALDRAIRP
ncbi:MarR family winged helix-turn-helix transcriptional regulator [Jiella marina]|uniref:MarR family winged helix-turn-helix transcriptional regulator n=1 Tax=Jiella sp. LLJ827 TaxID=2917712 RepID=UPI002101C6DD|nr:MarR family transcriptional regulator [Jiella sp. LLJ827]MCQ0988505.1 MarR family transcriptional regulator [Jiella sp. LLJ827]